MAETAKYLPVGGAAAVFDCKFMLPCFRTRRRTTAFAYGFIFAFMCFTAFFILNPTASSSSPWFTTIISSRAASTASVFSSRSYRSHFSTILIYFLQNSSQPSPRSPARVHEINSSHEFFISKGNSSSSHRTKDRHFETLAPKSSPLMNISTNSSNPNTKSANRSNSASKKTIKLANCNFYDGNWVRDELYPLYKPGSCSLIDEQFNCFLNGRPDNEYSKLKWKPRDCTLPRLNGRYMLKLLTGKRLVFVGDSLNRNMWESLVCVLRSSAKDPNRVYEARGRQFFRTDASYSFIFADYNCSIEFFVSPFLVQEWEVADKHGSVKETLRLDLIGKSSNRYKHADIVIFNTGHWWTHEKTSKGLDYYQEGSHVYSELNVLEAFRRAVTTWGRWVDANINPTKTRVFFRGYSASHFSGGQWSSGGQCDNETEPIRNATYLSPYPPKMSVLESVFKGMRTPVTYLNVTRMTDYRKDGHPSVYRKRNLSVEELRSSLMYQDCSHWCLPGVPDAWNELVYAELLRYRMNRG